MLKTTKSHTEKFYTLKLSSNLYLLQLIVY